ncbi:carbohydrate ABC transporter permease [Microbacterium resistens]|uniref:carbohydrate ABC transporter permease n=1 Tax=Microbacterium resistens TaxID=156977 RepID=UPI0027E35D4F|nr:carbohydrate ABC transporter permease [Microbacterium resistens]
MPLARRPKQGRKSTNHKRGTALLTVLLWTCVAYFVLPLVWLVMASTKTTADLFSTFGFGPGTEFALWDNIVEVFNYDGGIFGRWLLNTIGYSLTAACAAALVSTMAGYAFAKFQFPGSKILFSVALGAIMIPATALAVPQFVLASAFGLTNSPFAVIVPAIANPIGVFIMRVYAAEAIPDSLLEAGRVDGAGEFRIFFGIGLRLLAPGLVTVLLFSLVGAWNNYLLPLLMIRDQALYPVTVGLAYLNGQLAAQSGAAVNFSTIITGSLISVIPLLIAFAYLQRYWQTGLTTGAVK